MLLCTSLRCSRSASTCQTPLLSSLITTAAGYQGLGSVVAARCRIHWKLLWFLKRDISCPSTCWCSFRHSRVNNTLEDFLQNRASHVEKLLCRRWLARQPDSKISKILLSSSMEMLEDAESGGHGQVPLTLEEDCLDFETEITETNFYIIRDDLLHPLLGGNKLRKLDALLPLLEDLKATDVVTCGGSQSAHTAALACACAERGMRAHLLLRGERPSIPTGYSLLSSMYGYSSYVPRSQYADRTAMFMKYAATVAGTSGDVIWLDEPTADRKVGESSEKRVIVVREGAGDAVALLGICKSESLPLRVLLASGSLECCQRTSSREDITNRPSALLLFMSQSC